MSELLGRKILDARVKKKWSQTIMAKRLGISLRQYSKYESGQFPKYKTDILQKIDRLLGTSIMESINEQIVPHETSLSEPEVKYEGKKNDQALTMQALVNLTESNRILAESNKTLARSHEELVMMVKSTGSVEPKINTGLEARFSRLLHLIAQVGSGSRWDTIDEAEEALGKYVLDHG